MHTQIIHYYLVDDTVEIREVHEPNDGRDPFPVLVCRQKLPKNSQDIPCERQYSCVDNHGPTHSSVNSIVGFLATPGFSVCVYFFCLLPPPPPPPPPPLPLANFPSCVMEVSENEVKEWFSPKDFMIGKTVNIMGRRFFM